MQNMLDVTWNVETWVFALRGRRNREMEESASHHLSIICFAQLRAEIMENHAQEAWKSSEIMKILILF